MIFIIDERSNQDIGIYHVEYLCDFKSNDGHKMYHVKCNKCGFETNMRFSEISKAKSCKHRLIGGGYLDVSIRWNNKKLAKTFKSMKQRCYNPSNKDYHHYGEKGVRICDEWLKNPLLFEQWALENGYENGLSIDRKNSDKDYCPENCRWITLEDNAKYKSSTRLITVDGITKTGREWSRDLNLGINTINKFVRLYGEEKTKKLIHAMLTDEPKEIKHNQSWFDIYNIE